MRSTMKIVAATAEAAAEEAATAEAEDTEEAEAAAISHFEFSRQHKAPKTKNEANKTKKKM